MQERNIRKTVKGQPTVDGAGVHLTRVLGPGTVYDFDPFLILDSFDATDPSLYIKGFPHHPHRGIETITYLIEGEIDHEDSLGNAGRIGPGQSQWMTAGSGIIHQEMPQPSERMLGVQLWLNLPQRDKMTDPAYFDITEKLIGETSSEEADIRVISGEYNGVQGAKPSYVPATLLDVHLKEGRAITIPVKAEENAFAFLIEGDAVIDDHTIDEKTAVLFGEGDAVTVAAPAGRRARFLLCSAKPLGEPISWGGPIVMNSREELEAAFDDLDKGSFIRHQPKQGQPS